MQTVPPHLCSYQLALQAMTQHHFVLLYPSKIQYVNRTSKAVVQEVALQRFAAPVRGAATMPLGLCRDQLAGRIYVLAGGLWRGGWTLGRPAPYQV